MFDFLVLRWKLWRSARGRRKMYATFDRKIADARRRGAKADEIRGISASLSPLRLATLYGKVIT
jgi:hypothetical protein